MKKYASAIILAWALFHSPLQAASAGLVFWTTEVHQDRLEVIDFLVKAFMVMHDDVSVQVVSVNENDLAVRLREAQKSGDAPHLVAAGADLVVAMVERGVLSSEPASRIVRNIGVDRFYPGVLDVLAHRTKWYGVPFHGWLQGLWYRADWFEEAGLAPPANWEAILVAAKRLTDPAKTQYGILIGTALDQYAEQVFTQIAMANGAAMFDEKGRLVFDSPAMVEALEYYVNLARHSPKGEQTWRARDYYLQGKLAMMFYSTFIMDDLAMSKVAADSLGGDNFAELEGADFDPNLVQNTRMISTLRNKRGVSYGLIEGLGIRQGLSAAETAAVEQFIAFIYTSSHYVTWLHMAPGGMLPVLRDVAETDRFMSDPSGLFRRFGRSKIREIIEGLSSIHSFGMVGGKRYPAASVAYAEKVIPTMIHRTLYEGMTAEESVTQAAWEIERIIQSMEQQ